MADKQLCIFCSVSQLPDIGHGSYKVGHRSHTRWVSNKSFIHFHRAQPRQLTYKAIKVSIFVTKIHLLRNLNSHCSELQSSGNNISRHLNYAESEELVATKFKLRSTAAINTATFKST